MSEKAKTTILEDVPMVDEELPKLPHGDHHKKADAFIHTEILPELDAAAERRLRYKLDIWIMPLLTLNFMFNFIDRYVICSFNYDFQEQSRCRLTQAQN